MTRPVTPRPVTAQPAIDQPAIHYCGVLGSPIAHSLSPALHRAAYAALGLTDWAYDPYEVTGAGLADFIASRDASWRGLSLTMPLKTAVLPYGTPDAVVRAIGAANTLIFDADGPRLYNTDVGGMVGAVNAAGVRAAPRITVLGAGGTARAVLAAAWSLGAAEVTVVARDTAKVAQIAAIAEADEVMVRSQSWGSGLPEADLLISTVSAGAADAIAAEAAGSAPVVFDALYAPWPTALAAAAWAAGRTVIGGLDLLAHQAVRQVELMTGHSVEVGVLLAAGREALGSPPAAPGR